MGRWWWDREVRAGAVVGDDAVLADMTRPRRHEKGFQK
jgi:hypothetical protein